MDIGLILGLFIQLPALALVPAAGFAYGFVRCGRLIVLITSITWLAYFAYEQAMRLRILCSGECNIRVDLLLLYPALAALSAVALYVHWKARRGNRNS